MSSSLSIESSRKRKRSDSSKASAESSIGWNPAWDDDDDDSVRNDNIKQEGSVAPSVHDDDSNGVSDLPSQLPSSINIAIPPNDGSTNHQHQMGEMKGSNELFHRYEATRHSSDSSSNSTTSQPSPPERIRYQMLGAPTLLYRHAPSYVDTSNLPSTLSTQQISMLMYMQKHPTSSWFKGKDNKRTASNQAKSSDNPAKSLLYCAHMPQPPRPWGRAHDLDTTDDAKQQAELDVEALVSGLQSANRARVRSFWPCLDGDKAGTVVSTAFVDGNKRYAAFKSEYFKHYKVSNPGVADKVARLEAVKAWRSMSEEEKNSYGVILPKFTQARRELSEEKKAGYYCLAKDKIQLMARDQTSKQVFSQQNYSLLMQSTQFDKNKRRALRQTLDSERIKWLIRKEFRRERHDKERQLRRSILDDYYTERDVRRLTKLWESEDMSDSEKRTNNATAAPSSSSSLCSFSSSASSIASYDSEESAFYAWEAEMALHIDTLETPNDLSDDRANEKCYSIAELVTAIEQWKQAVERQRQQTNPYMENTDPLLGNPKSQRILKHYNMYASYSAERLNSGPDYTATFRRQDIDLPLNDDNANNMKEMIGNEANVEIDQGATEDDTTTPEHDTKDRNGVTGPSGYGNCLATFQCVCSCCLHPEHDTGQSETHPTLFLVHPTGEILSRVTISTLLLPRDDSYLHNGSGMNDGIDVGGRILQISICGASIVSAQPCQDICLVIRTSLFCSVVHATAKIIGVATEHNVCSTTFGLIETTRIDLRSSTCRSLYLPVHVACDPKVTISCFTKPTFAILSNNFNDSTSIHHVVLKDEPCVKMHSFSDSLASVSLIEFDPRDRMTLWAAARSNVMPTLTETFFKERDGHLAGYGHSLFQLNLRTDRSTYIWSPSHAEYYIEGFHSINGMMADALDDHLIWISSSSAGKIWALDTRYKSPKIIVNWSLPSLCEDIGAVSGVTGVYGAGVLMSQPLNRLSTNEESNLSSRTKQSVLFSARKDPSSTLLSVHQFPSAMPRFHTQPLESAGFQDIVSHQYSVSSVARSTCFPLPDSSEGIYTVGLATVQSLSLSALSRKELKSLGYQVPPSQIVYTFTMSSIGDIYCHSLLASDATEEPKAKHFAGLPVGTMAIPIPNHLTRSNNTQQRRGALVVGLSNEFPTPYSAITSYFVGREENYHPFNSFAVNELLQEGSGCARRAGEDGVDDNAPCSLYNLKSDVLSNRNVDTILVASSKQRQSDQEVFHFNNSDASVSENRLYKPTAIVHSDPLFGIKSQLAPGNVQLQLQGFHTTVALRQADEKENDNASEGSSVEVMATETAGEFSSELFEQLRGSFFSAYALNDNDNDSGQEVNVKSEWSDSDSE